MNKILKGIVPAGGLGSRMRLISKTTSKEMLLINNKPMIEYAIDNLISCGIREIAIIIHPDKIILKNHLRKLGEKIYAKINVNLSFIYQTDYKGLAHAIYQTRDFVGDVPFAVFLPDNIVLPKSNHDIDYSISLDYIFKRKANNISIIKIENENIAKLFSNSSMKIFNINSSAFLINEISDKSQNPLSLNGKTFIYKTFGNYYFLPEIFKYIKSYLKNDNLIEYDDVPILQQLAKEGKLFGIIYDCIVYDVGNPTGYSAANRYFQSPNKIDPNWYN